MAPVPCLRRRALRAPGRGISNGHIDNLRGRRAYRVARTTFRATRGAPSPIGKRRPRPEGRPGFVRVDTAHSCDLGGEKGLYVINMADEVTQFQQLAAVPRITEHLMVPVFAALVGAFPFRVLGFHAENGSEYVNHRVAAMLNRLHVEEFTKSRPRRSNDNALVESKNGNGYPAPTTPSLGSPIREHARTSLVRPT